MITSRPSTTEFQKCQIVWVAPLIVGLGGVIGASTNAINGAISPQYFRAVMRWHNLEDVWRASIAQGFLEGSVLGIVFAIVICFVLVNVHKGCFSFGFLARLVSGIYACWFAGGLLAMGLAALSPEMFRANFIGVPQEFEQTLRYAWVGGSIWGVQFGGLLTLIRGGSRLRKIVAVFAVEFLPW